MTVIFRAKMHPVWLIDVVLIVFGQQWRSAARRSGMCRALDAHTVLLGGSVSCWFGSAHDNKNMNKLPPLSPINKHDMCCASRHQRLSSVLIQDNDHDLSPTLTKICQCLNKTIESLIICSYCKLMLLCKIGYFDGKKLNFMHMFSFNS